MLCVFNRSQLSDTMTPTTCKLPFRPWDFFRQETGGYRRADPDLTQVSHLLCKCVSEPPKQKCHTNFQNLKKNELIGNQKILELIMPQLDYDSEVKKKTAMCKQTN